MNKTFDRTTQDVGNITLLEHVNLRVPDLGIATTFFVQALGLTRDPYIDLGPALVWFNTGRQQFHIPQAPKRADVLRGTIVLAVPGLDSLADRLTRTAPALSETLFGFEANSDSIEVTGPWGNRFRCLEEVTLPLGMLAVEFEVPVGTAAGIARFYQEVLRAPGTVSAGRCDVVAGPNQRLTFVEKSAAVPYDGHHIAVYVADFSGPHRWLQSHDLVVEESDQHQYRFNWIVDPSTSETLFEIEHEVRSHLHPLYARPLVNKNADQRINGYVRGADAFGGM